VRHARPAMMLRLKSGMYVVAVCIGERVWRSGVTAE
jgi:hypothetical protein